MIWDAIAPIMASQQSNYHPGHNGSKVAIRSFPPYILNREVWLPFISTVCGTHWGLVTLYGDLYRIPHQADTTLGLTGPPVSQLATCLTVPSNYLNWYWLIISKVLMVPSNYLNSYWLIISKVLWHSLEGIVIRRLEDTNEWNKIQ